MFLILAGVRKVVLKVVLSETHHWIWVCCAVFHVNLNVNERKQNIWRTAKLRQRPLHAVESFLQVREH